MNILHYSLGFPPYRTGGMTTFCVDLMEQQMREGHRVSLLWPGEMLGFGAKTRVKARGKNGGVESYEVIHPAPVSYDEGIVDIGAFTAEGDRPVYDAFLAKLSVDVLHVHTLMGLHGSLLAAAKARGVRIVFSAHDFFPICPKVTMFRGGQICAGADRCEDCPACNMTALSMGRIRLLQSAPYRRLKDSALVKKLRRQHRDAYLSGESAAAADAARPVARAEDYRALRRHYDRLLGYADVIHFNSTVTRDVYQRYMTVGRSAVVPITHAHIEDHRRKKDFDLAGRGLRLTYLGPASGAKGYFLLKEALDRLEARGALRFSLNVFFTPAEPAPYMRAHGRYDYSGLEAIFDGTDVLVAPSIWYETFGYTVLEALSWGVPVIISDRVGAKDVLPAGCGVVVENLSADSLAEAIEGLTDEGLAAMNAAILEKAQITTIARMSRAIAEKCYERGADAAGRNGETG